jgi:hypothetical protein
MFQLNGYIQLFQDAVILIMYTFMMEKITKVSNYQLIFHLIKTRIRNQIELINKMIILH